MKRWLKGFLKMILVIYLLVGIGLYFFQEKIMFHPTVLAADHRFQFTDSFKEESIHYDTSTIFHFIKFFPQQKAKEVVLYFHGNKGNIERYERFVKNFTKHNKEVWMVDYCGYGKSTGALNETMLAEEALQLYKMARVYYQPSQIIIYGKSLGTGIATQLASRRDCEKLILETPYYSMTSLARHYVWMYPIDWIVKYKFPSYQYLQKVTAPVTIFHGTDDNVVPYSNSLKLKAVLKPGDEFITINGGNHRNLNSYPLMQEKLDSLLK